VNASALLSLDSSLALSRAEDAVGSLGRSYEAVAPDLYRVFAYFDADRSIASVTLDRTVYGTPRYVEITREGRVRTVERIR